jgi:lipopolysaccharide transport system ATP-binding protein
VSEPIIQVENLGKKYIIGHQVGGGAIEGGFPTLRDRITDGANWLKRQLVSTISGQKITEPTSEEFWALKDVSFEIKRGDCIGIIGRNGAGKSTLLKILSRITEPTTGQININGRVASLLEVGTGFHPELTGRENVYLNGAILGMSKTEIEKKFDEIVEFAEVERFLDTPVKRYSSGMYVRLAFAVAAHLEPEILIVDEVLAVGDIQFQKKCLGKMQNVSQGEGRTVLFVSHNMDAIERLCSQSILFQKGYLTDYGNTNQVVTRYLSSNSPQNASIPNRSFDLRKVPRSGTGKARFVEVQYSSLNEEISFQPYSDGPLEFLLTIESDVSMTVNSLAVDICNQAGTVLVNADICIYGEIVNLDQGKNVVRLKIGKLHLHPGTYAVGLYLSQKKVQIFDHMEFAFEIDIINFNPEKFVNEPSGPVTCQFDFTKVI